MGISCKPAAVDNVKIGNGRDVDEDGNTNEIEIDKLIMRGHGGGENEERIPRALVTVHFKICGQKEINRACATYVHRDGTHCNFPAQSTKQESLKSCRGG